MAVGRLITISLSHFCEKARWALDATGVAYREEKHAPVMHLRATRKVGGKTVPVLVAEEGTFRDSIAICRHADAVALEGRRILPTAAADRARVLAIEEELGETLGVDARLLVYHHSLATDEHARALVGAMMRLRSPALQRLVAPLFRALVFRAYRVTPSSALRAETRIRETFARFGRMLPGDEGYLVAGRFTLADLTFAALASPLLAPPEHPVTGRMKPMRAGGLTELRAELAATPAGRHALRVYREHRSLSGKN